MKQFFVLKNGIYELGTQMVNCALPCEGISRDLGGGILPRCLYFEDVGRAEGSGSVVVGINPGNCWDEERNFYKSQGTTYEQLIAYWDKTIKDLKYYRSLRRFVDDLGLRGPILWTELAKCENAAKKVLPPLHTFRRCINRFLNKELKLVPDDWPIIAVGRSAYGVLPYICPERVVIGVPHPTSSRGQFRRLFDENWKLHDEFAMRNDEMRGDDIGKAVWPVTDPRHRGYR